MKQYLFVSYTVVPHSTLQFFLNNTIFKMGSNSFAFLLNKTLLQLNEFTGFWPIFPDTDFRVNNYRCFKTIVFKVGIVSGGDRLSVSSSAVACSEHSGQAFDLKSKRRYFELKVLWLKRKRFPTLRAKHWTLSYCIYCTAHVIPHELQCSKMFTCLMFWSSTCNAFISNLLRLGL